MTFKSIPGKQVEVPDLDFRDTVSLPADTSALLVIDMQNDFVKENGALRVPAAQDTVPNIQKLISQARERNMHIVYTQDTQIENDPEFEVWPEHAVRGSEGWQIIDELQPHNSDLICRKNRYDGFYGTWMDHFLSRIWKLEHLIIVGTVANICVLHTAASAGLRWYHVVMPANGISAMTEFDQALTLHQVSTLYSGEIVKSVTDISLT